MNSRRRIACSDTNQAMIPTKTAAPEGGINGRFGSFADIRRSKPGAALRPKADIEVTHRHVC